MRYSIEPSERTIQKSAEATGNLIGKKIADKISKKSSQNNFDQAKNKIKIPKERYIAPEKRQQSLEELRLV